jgi:hypothetical protein
VNEKNFRTESFQATECHIKKPLRPRAIFHTIHIIHRAKLRLSSAYSRTTDVKIAPWLARYGNAYGVKKNSTAKNGLTSPTPVTFTDRKTSRLNNWQPSA